MLRAQENPHTIRCAGSLGLFEGYETEAKRLTAAAAVNCNACERPRCGKQRAGVGVAVEKIEEKRQLDDFFGNRKRRVVGSSPTGGAMIVRL